MTKPEPGQLWIGRNYRSLLKIINVSAGVAHVKLLATGNSWLKERVGKTNFVYLEDLQAGADYVGDLI